MMRIKSYVAMTAAALALGLGAAQAADDTNGAARATVRRAVDALGGAAALRNVRTVTMQGQAKHWEPDQSPVAGGEARFLADSTMTIALDVAGNAARVDWDRAFQYPAVAKEKYTEVFADGVGYVHYDLAASGNPPDRAMSGNRVAAEWRELTRGSPVFLLALLDHPERLRSLPRQRIDGQTLDAVGYRQGGQDFVVMVDPTSHLPARIRVRDADSLQGDSNFDLVLGDFVPASGVQVARQVSRTLNGRPVEWIKFDTVAVNDAAAERFAIPPAIKASASHAAAHDVPYQWFLRRQWLGRLVDSDAVFYDAATAPGLKLVELGRGVDHVVGGSHNSMIVEMKDYLVVFDAPIHEKQSRWVIAAAKAKYPRKPIKYLVLTHHHMDHTSGVRTYAAEGATLIVGAPNKAFFTKVMAAPHTIDRDALQRNPRKVEIVEVADFLKLHDGEREVGIYRIDAKHAEGSMTMMVPDAGVAFVTDLYTPVRDPQPSPNLSDFLAGLQTWKLEPTTIAGGHGGSGPYADLMKIRSASAN